MLNVFTVWRQHGEIPPKTCYHCAEIVDGKIYIIGGSRDVETEDKHLDNSIHVYHIDLNTWKTIIPEGDVPPNQRCLSACVAIGSKIYVFGGYSIENNVHKCYNGMYVFDTTTNKWTLLATEGDIPSARSGATCVVHDDLLYVYGGCQGKSHLFSDLYSFNPITCQWKKINTNGYYTPKPRCCHSANVIEGNMYVFGGMVYSEGENDLISTNELWKLNLETFEWTNESKLSTGKIPEERACHVNISLSPLLLIAFGGDLRSNFSYQKNTIYTYHTQLKRWKKLETNDLGGLYQLPRRMGAAGVYDYGTKTIYIFGGKVGEQFSNALYYARQYDTKEIPEPFEKDMRVEKKRYSLDLPILNLARETRRLSRGRRHSIESPGAGLLYTNLENKEKKKKRSRSFLDSLKEIFKI